MPSARLRGFLVPVTALVVAACGVGLVCESLNAAVAVAIVMWELSKQAGASPDHTTLKEVRL